MIIQESRGFWDSPGSFPLWMRERRKWNSITVMLKSTSLKRTNRIGYWEGTVTGVKSCSLKEGANYQF